jgi:hypothetical protein
MKACGGWGEWSASHPDVFSLGKEPWYTLIKRLVRPQSQFGCFEEEMNFFPVRGLEPWFLFVQPTAWFL